MSEADIAMMNGFLQAFEALNMGADHQPSFSLDRLGESNDDAELSVAEDFRRTNYRFRLTIAENWKSKFESELNRWIFDLLAAPEPYVKQFIGERFFKMLDGVFGGEATEVWKIAIDGPVEGGKMQPFYECDWTDYLFRSSEGIFLLHFGVSD